MADESGGNIASKKLDQELWRNIRHENLYDGTISSYLIEVISQEKGPSFEEQELSFLRKARPRLGYYYLILRFDGLWGSGGMTHATLRDEFELNLKLLGRTIEAFRFYGAKKHADLIERLIPVAREAHRELEIAATQNKNDEDFKRIWARIDTFDKLYDDICGEYDPYGKIVEDAHKFPEEYVHP